MQYVGRAFDSVSKTWSSINPATLSGAIDVIVVEHPDGELACSPFHVRFGKFQILKPSQKKVEVLVNGKLTDIPMKLGDSGEAYFVFETLADLEDIPDELISSPMVSAASSPGTKPESKDSLEEPDFLDINDNDSTIERPATPTPIQRLTKKLTQKEIPSSVDNNGDLLLDIEGYKTSKDKVDNTNEILKQLLHDELGDDVDLSEFVKEDSNGNIRILNPEDSHWSASPPSSPPITSTDSLYLEQQSVVSDSSNEGTPSLNTDTNKSNLTSSRENTLHYIKTIRLTSKQLKCLDVSPGENDLTFSVDKGRAIVNAKLFYWKWDDPIVISDIDGTITKSDALGHVLTMIGKDWTHPGVAKLFTEISGNGYNIMYLTARTAGQSDSTRSYLRSIVQDGCQLPIGPVILSPDRTIAALRREVILKKPEVFKIACLKDMKALYFPDLQSKNDAHQDTEEIPTPFVAGFGNRITDALSYRSVGIPSSRIFTINPEGEVHMELLELAGYRSSYIHINELVDHFFPPVKKYPILADDARSMSTTPGSPYGTGKMYEEKSFYRVNDDKYTDANFWREPVVDLSDLSDLSDGSEQSQTQINSSQTSAHDGKHSINSSSNTNAYSNEPMTPTHKQSEAIGQKMYLDLGSPLSSPVLKMNDPELTYNLQHTQANSEKASQTSLHSNATSNSSFSEKKFLTLDQFSTPTPSTLQVQQINVYNNGSGPVMDQLQTKPTTTNSNGSTAIALDKPLQSENHDSNGKQKEKHKNNSSQSSGDETELEFEGLSDDDVYEDEFDEDEF